MHPAIIGIDYFLVGILLAIPLYFGFLQKPLLSGLLAGTSLVLLLTILLPWWASNSVDLELWFLNLDLEGWDAEERTKNVAPHRREYAERLFFSTRKMGIGWPLKAILAMFFTLPYAIITFLMTHFARGYLQKKRAKIGEA